MRVLSSKFLNFVSSPTLPPKGGEGASPLPACRVRGRVGGAYKVKKLAARDSHFLLNNFLIKHFGVLASSTYAQTLIVVTLIVVKSNFCKTVFCLFFDLLWSDLDENWSESILTDPPQLF